MNKKRKNSLIIFTAGIVVAKLKPEVITYKFILEVGLLGI